MLLFVVFCVILALSAGSYFSDLLNMSPNVQRWVLRANFVIITIAVIVQGFLAFGLRL